MRSRAMSTRPCTHTRVTSPGEFVGSTWSHSSRGEFAELGFSTLFSSLLFYAFVLGGQTDDILQLGHILHEKLSKQLQGEASPHSSLELLETFVSSWNSARVVDWCHKGQGIEIWSQDGWRSFGDHLKPRRSLLVRACLFVSTKVGNMALRVH